MICELRLLYSLPLWQGNKKKTGLDFTLLSISIGTVYRFVLEVAVVCVCPCYSGKRKLAAKSYAPSVLISPCRFPTTTMTSTTTLMMTIYRCFTAGIVANLMLTMVNVSLTTRRVTTPVATEMMTISQFYGEMCSAHFIFISTYFQAH